ncbi:MAG: phage holin family protein [Steroidobacteraceae bacterium]
MRLLWSLPKAAPALLRHIAGYAELAGEDLDQTQRDLGAQLMAGAILGLALFFAVFSACLLVVALTWDTPYRVSAIAWMGGVFLVIAIVAGVYRSNLVRAQAPFLATVRREWKDDRVILERILSSDQD